MTEEIKEDAKVAGQYKIYGCGYVTYPDGTVVPFDQEFLATATPEQLEALGIKPKEV